MQRSAKQIIKLGRTAFSFSKLSLQSKISKPMSFTSQPRFCFTTGSQYSEINLGSLESFETEVQNSTKPVVIDFHAEWCNPCKRLAITLKERLQQSEGKYKLVKIDIDDFPEIAEKFNVNVVPSVFLVHNNKVVDSFVGNQDEASYDAFFAKAINLG